MTRMVAAAWLLVFALAVMAGAVVYTFVVDPRLPVTVYTGARPEQTEAVQGDFIFVDFDIERRRTCAVVKAQPILTDSHGVSWPLAAGSGRLLESVPGQLRRAFAVPPAAAPGPAQLYVELLYQCLLMPIEVVTPTVFFEITEAETEEP